MKIFLLTLSLIGSAVSEAPYPPSGTKPEGALLLLPTEYKPTSSLQIEAEDVSKLTDSVMSRLQQEEGSDSGSYHVYLNDGSLQKVQYTTAPVKNADQQKPTGSSQPHPVVQQFGRLQQQLQAQQIQRLTDRLQYLEQEQRRLQEQQEQLKSASYVASLRFSNVEPIKPPIYSYKSDGLTRVLRYAPAYF